jgi:hypothetical protein
MGVEVSDAHSMTSHGETRQYSDPAGSLNNRRMKSQPQTRDIFTRLRYGPSHLQLQRDTPLYQQYAVPPPPLTHKGVIGTQKSLS